MQKREAEKIVRHFASDWARETDYERTLGNWPSYSAIREKVQSASPDALCFKSIMGVFEEVERWIDDELRVPGN